MTVQAELHVVFSWLMSLVGSYELELVIRSSGVHSHPIDRVELLQLNGQYQADELRDFLEVHQTLVKYHRRFIDLLIILG